MAQIDRVGAIMIYAKNAPELSKWYEDKLGITTCLDKDNIYAGLIPDTKIFFGIIPEDHKNNAAARNTMVNYHVTNFEDFCKELGEKDVEIEDLLETEDGTFGYIRDGEGNRIEIWKE